ncbi:MAG: B12-binding domain-containing radical SAM protein, partial [Planctomycetota bacterium]
LTSVFGPYAQDDEYGSRAINPMELYHNQVTRVQRAFSVRMFHRSWGLMLIQANIGTRCTLLDFPSLDRFLEQITANHYDIVGISAIMPNVDKVRKMCALVREHLPRAAVVVGGHIANLPGLDERIDADYIVRGEGVRWMRRFLSEDESQPVRHPQVLSGFGARTAGVTLRAKPGDVAAILIPSVGCPLGCNFCATSAMFGGKGKFVHFYETGDELFEVMCELEKALNVWSFFVMDENFLLYRKRALRLLDLMVEHDKSWALYVFSSANVLRSYTIEQLVGLGVSWVWVGLEGKDADFVKLRGTDTRELVRTLQAHGIRVLGSSIIGLEEHTPQNIDEVIDYAVSHDADFHQFMLYTPIPGTPLHEEFRARGTLLDAGECAAADVHGQLKFNFRHPHITDGQETELLLRAFRRDFEFNGPSISRLVRTTLQGWQRYKNHPDRRIRQRFAREARGLAVVHAGGLWAARRWFRRDPALSAKIARILKDAYREFGLTSRLAAPVVGRYLYLMIKHEDRRLRRGWTYEPPTLCETSWMAAVGAHA